MSSKDPNRIIERIEKLLAMARSAIDEAEAIADCPDEPLRIQREARKLMDKFYEDQL
jgi:hypothetical protein